MASDTVTATVDVQHVERQLLEAVSSPGFGPIASNALLAVRGLRAELARVTAERDATRRENYETALKLEQWETAHPWTGSDGDPIQDPHKVRRLWEASERDLLARAEKAEAARDSAERRMDAMRSECHAVASASFSAESEAVGASMRLMAGRVLDAGDLDGEGASDGE